MKKLFLILFITIINIPIFAQTINVHFKNGQTINLKSSNVDYLDFSEKESIPPVTDMEAVDLGLSVLWASCNLGAKKPEEAGDKYAWGEVKTKSSFEPEDYAFYDKDLKVCTNIGNSISGTEFDAARVNLGGSWKMPTAGDFAELNQKCTWEWTKINDVLGYKVTGENGNSIFLPALYYEQSGRFWTGDMTHDDGSRLDFATSFFIHPDRHGNDSNQYRYNGLFIRPVKIK